MTAFAKDSISFVSRNHLTDEDTCAACRNQIQRERRQEIITHPNCIPHGMTHAACLLDIIRRPLIPHINSVPCPACHASLNPSAFRLRVRAIAALTLGTISPGFVILLGAITMPILRKITSDEKLGKYWKLFFQSSGVLIGLSYLKVWTTMPRGEAISGLTGVLSGLALHLGRQIAGQNPSLKSSVLVASFIGALCQARRLFNL